MKTFFLIDRGKRYKNVNGKHIFPRVTPTLLHQSETQDEVRYSVGEGEGVKLTRVRLQS